MAVVIPETQEEVIETIRLCHTYEIPFVARGSGTSLSGASLPVAEGIVIALNRLNRILRLDPQQRIAVVECGVINLDVSRAAAAHGLYFAPDPSSQLICTIGGNLAFNSGGAHCLKYGMTSNHVLGLKVVLPEGEVINLGGESLETIGPDLVGFMLVQGLFGIILEVTYACSQTRKIQHGKSSTALEAAGKAVSMVVASVSCLERIMDNLAIQAAEAAVHAGYPLDAEGLLIVELDGEAAVVEKEFTAVMEVIEESGPYEIRIAKDEADRQQIWKGRKSAFSAVGRLSSDYLVQDGVVPRSRLGEALVEIQKLSKSYGIRVANVFHAGDGNRPLVHFDGREVGAYEKAEELAGDILRFVLIGGSITGEHGIE
jgi:glycolate oxidase